MSVHTLASAPPTPAARHDQAPRPRVLVAVLDLDAVDGPLTAMSEPADVVALVRLRGLPLGVLDLQVPIGPALPLVLRRAALMRFGAEIADRERRDQAHDGPPWIARNA